MNGKNGRLAGADDNIGRDMSMLIEFDIDFYMILMLIYRYDHDIS